MQLTLRRMLPVIDNSSQVLQEVSGGPWDVMNTVWPSVEGQKA